MASTDCGNTDVSLSPIADTNNIPRGMETEHPLDGQIMQFFGRQIANGRFRNGTSTRTPAVSQQYLAGDFQSASLPAGLGRIGDGRTASSPQIPMRRVMEELGSIGNSTPFLLTERSINAAKGLMMRFHSPIDLKDTTTGTLNVRIAEARQNPNTPNINAMFAAIREGIATFRYMSDALFIEHWQSVVSATRAQFMTIEANQPAAIGLVAHWDEFVPAHLREVAIEARTNVRTALQRIGRNFMGSRAADNQIRAVIADLEAQIETMVFPPDLYKTK